MQVFATKIEKTVRCPDCSKLYKTTSEEAPCPYCGDAGDAGKDEKSEKPKKPAQNRRRKKK